MHAVGVQAGDGHLDGVLVTCGHEGAQARLGGGQGGDKRESHRDRAHDGRHLQHGL